MTGLSDTNDTTITSEHRPSAAAAITVRSVPVAKAGILLAWSGLALALSGIPLDGVVCSLHSHLCFVHCVFAGCDAIYAGLLVLLIQVGEPLRYTKVKAL
jgi:hypothetical protein